MELAYLQSRERVSRLMASRTKRACDVVVALLGIVFLVPLALAIALAIVAESGRPVIYRQQRVGLGGRQFAMWKFRTMISDADALRASLLPLNEAPFPAFKLKRDPRITRVGRFLRMSSLDELPQLVNVVRGEMSLVGPRPPLPDEVAHYDDRALTRLAVRPGITGTWQVAHRHCQDISFAEWVEMDLEYIEDWSLALDFRLLARTVVAVVKLRGV